MEIKNLEKFYGKQYKVYDFTRKFFLFNRKKSIDLLNIRKGEKVIDLSCGTGLNIPFLLQKTQSKNILGIDYSPSLLKIAREKYPDVRFVEGDVSNYKFSKKADKIISSYSISMIDDWKKTIINVKKSLKNDGIFLILDFHPWKGPKKIVYPLFRLWLRQHGVNTEKKVIPFLKKHFANVDIHLLGNGYNYIAIAKNPLK